MRVAILQKYIPFYRRPFFDLLRQHLGEMDIELTLVHGQAGQADAKKKDAAQIDWATYIPSKIFSVSQHEFYWQPVLSAIKGVDLVIVEQANKLLINYLLLAQDMLGIRNLAYWGHGRNFQATQSHDFSERLKSFLATRVHWWFAYNELSANIVHEHGYPRKRITVVQNAIDTRELIASFQSVTAEQLESVRMSLGLKGKKIGLYVGAMYADKGVAFLLDACYYVKNLVPDFEMIFIGTGPDAHLVETASNNDDWIHYIGPCFDLKRVPYFAVSSLLLLPRAVGLSILDSFAMETPLVTTNAGNHGPEIQYLQNGINGVMVQNASDPKVYGQAIVDLLQNDGSRQTLVDGCRTAREQYTIEAMAANFAHGIKRALQD